MSTNQAARPPTANRILAALPDEEYARLDPHLMPVNLSLRQIIYKPLEPIKHIYFPENAMISIVTTSSEGVSVEVGVVGREGVTGIPALLGVDATPNESMVQIADGALKMRAEVAREEFKRGGVFQDLILRYIQANTIQIGQSVACNRLHSIDERLARWLLMTHDRAASDELMLTQEFLSMMLGVRRAGVTDAAITLQADGYINYKRGHITILDRAGLEEASCECYSVVKAEHDRILKA
jgi:CRP-like cAMP-binding protein